MGMELKKRERMSWAGFGALVGSAGVVELFRTITLAIFSLLLMPILAVFFGLLMGGFASIVFFCVLKLVFNVNFTERLLAKGVAYGLGSVLPMGLIVSTAITGLTVKWDDARYNEAIAKTKIDVQKSAAPSVAPSAPSAGRSVSGTA